MSERFSKIGQAGEVLDKDAIEWAAVLDNTTGLMWDAGEHKPMAWKKANEFPKTLEIAGFKDWRLPTVEELFLLADRNRFNPAINDDFFSECEGGWYWSSTVDASSPGDYAWYVYFYGGNAYINSQDYEGLVRAVRARQ